MDYDFSTLESTLNSTSDYEKLFAVFAAMFAALIGFIVVLLIIWLIVSVSRWKIFKKAGKPGWISFIPNYNSVLELQISGIPGYYWFFTLLFSVLAWIPIYGGLLSGLAFLVYFIWKNIKLAKAFGKGTAFGVLMVFFPFIMYPILGFGGAEYQGTINE